MQRGEGTPEVGGRSGTGRQRVEGEVVARQVGIDHRATTAPELDEASRCRDGEGQAPGQQLQQRHGEVHPGRRQLTAGRPDHPPAVLGVLDEGDVVVLLGHAREGLDAHRVQTRDAGAREGCEEGRGAFHAFTVCRAAL